MMGNSKMQPNKNTSKVKKNNLGTFLGIAAILIGASFIFNFNFGSSKKTGSESDETLTQTIEDVKITKSDITDTATFIPVKAGNIDMELIAVKASDGTVRTAFNTCQVCYDSGRGYYIQEGNELVCQNCGNRFKIDQVEKQRNGCNPAPITEEDKTDNGETITIPGSFIAQYTELFSNWQKA